MILNRVDNSLMIFVSTPYMDYLSLSGYVINSLKLIAFCRKKNKKLEVGVSLLFSLVKFLLQNWDSLGMH